PRIFRYLATGRPEYLWNSPQRVHASFAAGPCETTGRGLPGWRQRIATGRSGWSSTRWGLWSCIPPYDNFVYQYWCHPETGQLDFAAWLLRRDGKRYGFGCSYLRSLPVLCGSLSVPSALVSTRLR